MTNLDWHSYFFSIAKIAASKSKDPSSKIGSVAVRPDNTIASVGFNGFPRGVIDSEERYNDREQKYKYIVHSEINLICSAAKNGVSLDGCKIYLDFWPCEKCSQAIIQAGLKEIVLDGDSFLYNNVELNNRWKKEQDISKTMLNEAGIKVTIYRRENA